MIVDYPVRKFGLREIAEACGHLNATSTLAAIP